MQNLSAPAEPSDAQLATYFADHADRYAAPSHATFSHVFFAVGADGDATAQARAKSMLEKIPAHVTRAPERGDIFPDLYDFSAFEPEQVERLFGRTEFAKAVFTAPIGRWSGPFHSAYGWHLLYVANRAGKTQPQLADVRERVRSDDLQDAQDRANAATFDKIAKHFTVVRTDRKAGS